MSFSAKIRLYSIIIAISAAFICPLFFSYGTEAANAEPIRTMTFDYIMSPPVAAAADGDSLYVLTANGRIVSAVGGMETAGEAEGARFIAAKGGKIITDSKPDAVGVFAGTVSGEITPKAIYIYGSGGEEVEEVFATAAEGAEFVGGCAEGDNLFVAEKFGGRVSLYAYGLADNSAPRTLIKNEIKTDGEITSMTVTRAGDVYYSTPYSLYLAGKSKGYDVGGITSLASGNDTLYYTTRSGKVCRFGENGSETVLCASEKISVATRNNFACFADYGNNSVTVLRDGNGITAPIEQPSGIAIDYAGMIYVASENKVLTFTRSLENIPHGDITFADNTDYLTEIKIDLSDVSGNALYAVTENGKLLRTSDSKSIDGVRHVEVSPDGEIFVMTTNGSVVKYDGSLVKGETVCAAGDYSDFALDLAGNVYRAGKDGVYRNEDTEPVFKKNGISELAVSMIELTGNNEISYGDIIAISDLDCASTVLPGDAAGTDMKNDPNDASYVEFKNRADSAAANATDYAPDIRKAVAYAGIYKFPAESPAPDGREVNIGANVIVIAEYTGTDYYYVIAEAGSGSVKGFVNRRMLSAPVELKKLYDENECAPITKADVYKYPSLIAPKIGVSMIGKTYPLLDFAEGYRDSGGQGWCRIAYSDNAGVHDGYILRTNVSVDGTTGGENRQIVPDAVIKADRDFVETYLDSDGEFQLGQIANGTKIKLEEDYKKGNKYTKITYIGNEETGSTLTCYVLTEYMKHTEAGWYQVIMFIVAGVIIVAIAVIIVIRVKKKRKID